MLCPDPVQVRALNDTIGQRLDVALDHLICGVLQRPRPALWSRSPAAHGLQALFREAAIAGDIAAIGQLHDRHGAVLEGPAPGTPTRIVALQQPDLSDSEIACLQAAFADDIGLTERLIPPPADIVARLQADVPALLARLRGALPLWADEFEALVALIVLATTPEGRFGGASAFAAWGAILLNPAAQGDRLALLMTLIHESSHLKLFGAYLDDEIVLNAPDDRFASPLRREPRPMNGIYHAAFVLARMIACLDDLRASGQAGAVLGDGSEARLDEFLAGLRRQFHAGYGMIAEHGRLTPLGRDIIHEAAATVGHDMAGQGPA